MRARGLGKWAARGGLALLAMTTFSLLAAPGAQAAAPAGSLKPFLNCYWDNGDNSVTVSLGVSSGNAAAVSVPVGTDNRVTQGAADRGQPTSFANGVKDNVWALQRTRSPSFTQIPRDALAVGAHPESSTGAASSTRRWSRSGCTGSPMSIPSFPRSAATRRRD